MSVWDDIKRFGGDLQGFLDEQAAKAADPCERDGHQFQLRTAGNRPTRVTCKRCPAEWKIAG